MSSTGVWVVCAIPDEAARNLPMQIISTVQHHAPAISPAYAESLAWWSGGGDGEPFFEAVPDQPESLLPTSAAQRFAELVESSNPHTEALAALRDAIEELRPPVGDPGLFEAHAYRANPVAALWYALGAADSARLPGWFGDFLLTGEEVRAAILGVERALTRNNFRLTQATTRISAWMTVMGAEPKFDAEELLVAPLRVLRHCAEHGLGAAAFSRWY